MSWRADGYESPGVVFKGPGRTKQSFKAACDVNNIVEKFQKTGLITHLAAGVPRYADISAMPDYRSALDLMKQAESYFMSLPAAVRELFGNDVAAFVDKIDDEEFRAGFDEAAREAVAKIAAGGDQPKEAPKEGSELA